MKVKKMITVAVAVTFLVTLFVGCSTNEPAQEQKEEQKEQTGLEEGSKEPIVISTTGEHAFFSETNEETGELQGFEIDVWTEIGKRLDREIRWETAGFPGIIRIRAG